MVVSQELVSLFLHIAGAVLLVSNLLDIWSFWLENGNLQPIRFTSFS